MTRQQSPDIRKTAHHESGHTVAAWLFGMPVEYVSIGAGDGHFGVTRLVVGSDGSERPEWQASFDPSLPVLLQPPDLRIGTERRIVYSLAGPIAGRLSEPTSGYREADPCEDRAAKAATDAAVQSPRLRELIEADEGDPPGTVESDEGHAIGISHALTGDHGEAARHLAWLELVAQGLVVDRWYRVAALADALLEHTYLPGETAFEVIANAKRPTPTQERTHGA